MEEQLTFGQKAVGLRFNPSELTEVDHCKQRYADQIDQLNDQKQATESSEQYRLLSIAITEAQTAQMWAVKALTWRD